MAERGNCTAVWDLIHRQVGALRHFRESLHELGVGRWIRCVCLGKECGSAGRERLSPLTGLRTMAIYPAQTRTGNYAPQAATVYIP